MSLLRGHDDSSSDSDDWREHSPKSKDDDDGDNHHQSLFPVAAQPLAVDQKDNAAASDGHNETTKRPLHHVSNNLFGQPIMASKPHEDTMTSSWSANRANADPHLSTPSSRPPSGSLHGIPAASIHDNKRTTQLLFASDGSSSDDDDDDAGGLFGMGLPKK